MLIIKKYKKKIIINKSYNYQYNKHKHNKYKHNKHKNNKHKQNKLNVTIMLYIFPFNCIVGS